MNKQIFYLLVFVSSSFCSYGQTMEERVNNYLETFLLENKFLITDKELLDTPWATSDPMGKSSIKFSLQKFKKQSSGFQAKANKVKGRWYINNEFVVLEVKNEKAPLYVLKNEGQTILVDDDQIDVLKQLLTEVSYKDDELKSYSYPEIFTFLNGFTLQK